MKRLFKIYWLWKDLLNKSSSHSWGHRSEGQCSVWPSNTNPPHHISFPVLNTFLFPLLASSDFSYSAKSVRCRSACFQCWVEKLIFFLAKRQIISLGYKVQIMSLLCVRYQGDLSSVRGSSVGFNLNKLSESKSNRNTTSWPDHVLPPLITTDEQATNCV